MKLLKIRKDAKPVKLNKPMLLKMKTNLKAGSWDWLWNWPEPEEKPKPKS
jgi:hypothetical protein